MFENMEGDIRCNLQCAYSTTKKRLTGCIFLVGIKTRSVAAIVGQMFYLRKGMKNNFYSVWINIDCVDASNSAFILSAEKAFRVDNAGRLQVKI